MSSALPYLLQLPLELLLELSDFLPPDGILALKLTHSILNNRLPALPRLKNRTLDQCARFAIDRHRASPRENRQQRRCIFCKMRYPISQFSSSSSPACLPLAFDHDAPRPEIVELPDSFCAWHVGRLARVVRTGPGGRNEWVSDVRRMCMHNGCVDGWHECICGCGSCGYKMVRTYTRFLNNKTECKRFHFWRNVAAGPNEDPREKIAGRLYVQEACWDSSEFGLVGAGATPEKSIIQFPVRYQDVAG
ncbi:hypothetical protein P171DRAFT_481304 [Karstenula rhodostoma CBS 690.94]|uniref:F-box domain-containing protein n=1 Tax=Karstenula rhodostoma CBS 690.94 TaxID=1392251 RepID=A0A9P4PQA1_9PLEO|nr:hypothetical protein P171DRAFT_481304 [Karstenula rhodostoma CBS 690.94]